ncbi:hypothetical protein [Clostridium beijerinckii]|uniref:Uncharacterized protein n=1 Tax=Clostridium beijerinckii TaxID=1520 RepID=A0AAX0AXS2_CLOBE|nr:hypothetical protein [Clostridium beijerinckii]NRT87885.1 hypothetical protein [Clostridium beijerinckii]NYC73314.1 hypothetical protein [Clostridium beijerinckii]
MYFVFRERDNKIIHIDEITPSENGQKLERHGAVWFTNDQHPKWKTMI